MTALVHNGAFLLVDAINPDGSIVPDIYHKLMKRIYNVSRNYEKYVNGNLNHNASIWFASHAKYDPYCSTTSDKGFHHDISLITDCTECHADLVPWETALSGNTAVIFTYMKMTKPAAG